MHSLAGRCAVAATLVLVAVVSTSAGPVSVGSGDNRALVVINFSDGAAYEFDVAFSIVTIGGLDAFDIIEADSTLTTVRQDFGWGVFIDGISYEGHSNVGYLGGEDWWHYWVYDADQDSWVSPELGAAGRTLTDGCADGWVYGSANPPVVTPEPATAGLLAVGGLAMLRRRRQRCAVA